MKIINKISLVVAISTTLFFSACGGGGGGDASFKDAPSSNQEAVVSCVPDITAWNNIFSGDSVAAASGAQLKFDHDSSGNKKVCTLIGTANIIKG